MSKKHHKIIPRQSIPVDKQISKPVLSDSGFRFVTAYPWLKVTGKLLKKDGFTNNLQDATQFSKYLVALIEKTISKINQDSTNIFDDFSNRGQYPHCHYVSKDKIQLVQRISLELHDNDFSEVTKDSDYSWWELGFNGSSRIFGIMSKSDNCFYPLFVDWHHLIYPDIKHNSNDYKNYKYDPHII
ncbi:hypothetical protein [Companilactobacillus paralimentarius]|uniref:hypothetical protein n=1 Tax=Companilactobacillus paralimentarius TaxID=83526 RepID=UPI0037E03CD8